MAKILVAPQAAAADAKVFEVPYESQADLCWYEMPHAQQAEGDAVWCFVDHAPQATFSIFRVKYESQANLKIFKVKYREQAGWRNAGHALRGKLD
ncbi:hypothetical protein DBR23_15100 [Acidovorax sp. HMWF018]|jgi:hypothetical protein|uniref:DUF6150 family protein n=1 Tax=Acidovorax sp. HMWF018 TaxID=2056855 RepID=UPI000D38D221|nr:DUF6150 family protein [Acidovorax sp. HMWF018]PTT38186.1 hypothetical protein DBR23_15100 [Acidovorax sp. HMWF018]